MYESRTFELRIKQRSTVTVMNTTRAVAKIRKKNTVELLEQAAQG